MSKKKKRKQVAQSKGKYSSDKSGIKRVLMGSVAQNVIGNAPCPILVVPSLD